MSAHAWRSLGWPVRCAARDWELRMWGGLWTSYIYTYAALQIPRGPGFILHADSSLPALPGPSRSPYSPPRGAFTNLDTTMRALQQTAFMQMHRDTTCRGHRFLWYNHSVSLPFCLLTIILRVGVNLASWICLNGYILKFNWIVWSVGFNSQL